SEKDAWSSSRTGTNDLVPDRGGSEGQAGDTGARLSDRVADGIGDGPAQPRIAAFAQAAQAEGVRGRRHFLIATVHRRHVGRIGQGVVHESAGERLAAWVVL